MERLIYNLHKEEDFDSKIQMASALIQALPKLEDVESKSEDLFKLESKVHKVTIHKQVQNIYFVYFEK